MGLPGMIARIVRPGMWRPALRDSKSRFSLPSPLSVPLKAGAPQEVQVAVLGDPVGPYDPFSLDELLLDFGAMQILGACRVVDPFFEWGSHNTEWRLGRKVIEPADAVEVVLSYYSPLAWRILVATPIACLRAEFTAEDIPLMAIADGRPVGEWAEA